ncbi:butyrophilin subfamily 3 member A2-like [Mergus octosetaceus]
MGLPWGCGHPSLTGHARGLLTSLVTLLLLQLGSAQLRVEGPGHPLTATVGQDVVLPCHLSPQRDARSLEVRWIRDSISETVHHYRNGEDLYGEQMGAYAGWTELFKDGLSAGSLDLRITGLRPSDDGRYICTVENADAYNEATVTLEVSATGADPHLSLGGYEAGGVRVLCRSAGWYPLPQLLWRDACGQHLPSVSQTHSQDQEGLFEIEGAVIVTGSVEGPLSCVVRSSHLQQGRESSLHIAAPFFHNAQPWMVALAVLLVLLAVSIGLGVYLFRKQAAQSRELGESLQSLPPAPGEVVSLREGLGWVGSGGLCAGGSGVLEEQLEPGRNKLKSWVSVAMLGPQVRKDIKIVSLFLGPRTTLRRCAGEGGQLGQSSPGLAPHPAHTHWAPAMGCDQLSPLLPAWRRCLLPQNRVKVTLDPDTAHPMLVVSQDNSSVRWEREWQQVPDTPERFDSWCCVLGREEFRDGMHFWEVQISVCLDCTQRQVSFINADNVVEIFTFTEASFNGESIRPWFLLWTQGIQLCLRDSTP